MCTNRFLLRFTAYKTQFGFEVLRTRGMPMLIVNVLYLDLN